MGVTEIERKQELLKTVKRELTSRCGSLALIIAVLSMVQLSTIFLFANQSSIFAFAQSLVIIPCFLWIVAGWSRNNIIPVANKIRELKAEIKEAMSAQWRDETISKIRSGEISPV